STGGETVPIPTSFPNVALLNISSDRSELLVSSFTGSELAQSLWAVPVLGGSPRRVLDSPGIDGTWLPDGTMIVSRLGELLRVGTSGATRVASVPGFPYWFRLSPDGTSVRYTISPDSGPPGIWETSLQRKNLTRVMPSMAARIHTEGSWSPS